MGVPVLGATTMGASVGALVAADTEGFQESQWVFLWWEH
jgi:hypothetical protein